MEWCKMKVLFATINPAKIKNTKKSWKEQELN